MDEEFMQMFKCRQEKLTMQFYLSKQNPLLILLPLNAILNEQD